MVRELDWKKLTGIDRSIHITDLDGPTRGGASFHYQIEVIGPDGVVATSVDMQFQQGGFLEAGPNGITNEVLLVVLIDRLFGFQWGQFACRENSLALIKLQEALHWLNQRTEDRQRRGVEGTQVR